MTSGPDSPSRRTVVRRIAQERAERYAANGIVSYRWEDYSEACQKSEPIDLATVNKADLMKADARRKLWRSEQLHRIKIANMLRRTFVETLGASPTVLVGGEDEL